MKRVSTPLIFITRAPVEERMSLSKTPKPNLAPNNVEPDEANWCRGVFVCHLPDEVVFSPIFLTRP